MADFFPPWKILDKTETPNFYAIPSPPFSPTEKAFFLKISRFATQDRSQNNSHEVLWSRGVNFGLSFFPWIRFISRKKFHMLLFPPRKEVLTTCEVFSSSLYSSHILTGNRRKEKGGRKSEKRSFSLREKKKGEIYWNFSSKRGYYSSKVDY